MQKSLDGKNIVDKMAEYFEMLYAFKATCLQLPEILYKYNVELRVLKK